MQEQSDGTPKAGDSEVSAALNAQKRLQAAMQNLDFDAVEELLAPDLAVHAPVNVVVDRDNVLTRLRGGQINYEPDIERKIEFAEVRGDGVVIMGEEIVRPTKNAPGAGKTIHRRFTDVWKKMEGRWRLAIRQATITSTL